MARRRSRHSSSTGQSILAGDRLAIGPGGGPRPALRIRSLPADAEGVEFCDALLGEAVASGALVGDEDAEGVGGAVDGLDMGPGDVEVSFPFGVLAGGGEVGGPDLCPGAFRPGRPWGRCLLLLRGGGDVEDLGQEPLLDRGERVPLGALGLDPAADVFALDDELAILLTLARMS